MSALAQPDWVAHRAGVMPGKVALIEGARDVTYADLNGWADAVAATLFERGVTAGDRVALLAPNSLEFAAAVHGISRAGAVLVPLNARLTADDQAWQVSHSGAKVVLFHGDAEARARAVAKLAGIGAVALTPNPSPPGWRREQEAGDPDVRPSPLQDHGEGPGVRAHSATDVHSIIYTSGTTGRPKGAMLTYGNFFASASASAFNIGVAAGDRWLACMPLFHVGGLSILLRSAIYGTTAVIQPGFDEAAVNRAVREDGITLLSVVPTMLRRMLDADDLPYPPGMRAVLVGGGPVTKDLLEQALLRGLPVLQTYGLTESCSQVSTLTPADAAARVGSAGKPLVTTQLRIDAPPREPGEILVAGPTVTPGYHDDPEATARAIRDGWLHTGDIGRLDDEGFLYVLDRRDDLVITGGENVYPAEVEGHLLQHPCIDAAAVVGVRDARWGQVVTAAVVTRPGFDAAEVETWLRDRLAHYKVPRRFVEMAALPATASGKVQRHKVREMVEGG